MKTERRHELQTNALADALGQAVDRVKPFSQMILGAVLAAVIIFGVVKYLSVRSQEDTVDAWNLYLQGVASQQDGVKQLESVVNQYPDTAAAPWAHVQLADRALAQGIEQLFQNRADANENLRKAEQHYQSVKQMASDPLLLERATLGLARVYESQVQLDKARQQYQEMLSRWPEGAYAKIAQQRLDDLEQTSTKEFYDWFARNEPASTTDGPGTPGSRPSFDLDAPHEPLNLNLTTPDDSNKTSQADGKDGGASTEQPQPDAPVSTARAPAGEPEAGQSTAP